MNYYDMKTKINKYEKLRALIKSKKKAVSNLKACRYSPYDSATLAFAGNVGTSQYELDTDIIDVLIRKYEKDIKELIRQKDEMGMD